MLRINERATLLLQQPLCWAKGNCAMLERSERRLVISIFNVQYKFKVTLLILSDTLVFSRYVLLREKFYSFPTDKVICKTTGLVILLLNINSDRKMFEDARMLNMKDLRISCCLQYSMNWPLTRALNEIHKQTKLNDMH